jgi:hypothetical protein
MLLTIISTTSSYYYFLYIFNGDKRKTIFASFSYTFLTPIIPLFSNYQVGSRLLFHALYPLFLRVLIVSFDEFNLKKLVISQMLLFLLLITHRMSLLLLFFNIILIPYFFIQKHNKKLGKSINHVLLNKKAINLLFIFIVFGILLIVNPPYIGFFDFQISFFNHSYFMRQIMMFLIILFDYMINFGPLILLFFYERMYKNEIKCERKSRIESFNVLLLLLLLPFFSIVHYFSFLALPIIVYFETNSLFYILKVDYYKLLKILITYMVILFLVLVSYILIYDIIMNAITCVLFIVLPLVFLLILIFVLKHLFLVKRRNHKISLNRIFIIFLIINSSFIFGFNYTRLNNNLENSIIMEEIETISEYIKDQNHSKEDRITSNYASYEWRIAGYSGYLPLYDVYGTTYFDIIYSQEQLIQNIHEPNSIDSVEMTTPFQISVPIPISNFSSVNIGGDMWTYFYSLHLNETLNEFVSILSISYIILFKNDNHLVTSSNIFLSVLINDIYNFMFPILTTSFFNLYAL